MTTLPRPTRRGAALVTALALVASVLTLISPASAATTLLKVNFQARGGDTPSGWTPDYGDAYTPGRGFGWVDYDGSGKPVDMTHGATTRYTGADHRNDSFVHMQPWQQQWGRWVMQVDNGTYEIEVTVGDAANDGGLHTLIAEETTIIDRWSSNGQSARTKTATAAVKVRDNRLTLLPVYNTRTKLVSAVISKVDTADAPEAPAPSPSAGTTKFNFQPEDAPRPAGYTIDWGRPYDNGRGHGWVFFEGTGQPADMLSNTFDRNNHGNQVLDTFINMKKYRDQWGLWELAVDNGTYAVAATVGDSQDVNTSRHSLQVEGEPFFSRWKATNGDKFNTVTKTVTVSDGRLTVHPFDGLRTKLVSIEVTATTGGGSGGGTGGGSPPPTTQPTTTTTAEPDDGTNSSNLPGNKYGAISGFAPGGKFTGLSNNDIIRELDLMAGTGAKFLRMPFLWSALERNKGQYNFDRLGWIAQRARERGIELIANLSYTPPWARVGSCANSMFCEPQNPADYARFAGKVVDHFKPLGVDIYELWNEPNMKVFWEPKPNPAKYSNLVKQAYRAMKAANGNITVLAGALAPARDLSNGNQIHPETFLRRMYDNGVKGNFDALSFHPYSFPARPDGGQEWNAFSGVMPDLHEIMKSKGDGWKKIWGTEFGFPTRGERQVTEEFQREMVEVSVRTYDSYPFSAALIWYSYRDASGDKGNYHENFGLVNWNWVPKPALSEFKRVMRLNR